MPKLEPKIIQKELDQGRIWPLYWLYGQERMKSRELLKRIRTATGVGEGSGGAGSLGVEYFDGSETSAEEVVDAARSMSLLGGTRFIIVRDAHALKDAEALARIAGPAGSIQELGSVVVCLSKDLDARKKSSKLLLEHAAVVPCEDVSEGDRDAWIQFLSKRRGLDLTPEIALGLRALDPWSLDIVDLELEKLELSKGDPEVLQVGSTELHAGERFLDALMNRELKPALTALDAFAEVPDEALPLLGLLVWNSRYLAISLTPSGARGIKINPYLAERLRKWGPRWTLDEAIELTQALAELDYSTKQTPRTGRGNWTRLATQFCRVG